MKISVAQIRPAKGDITANISKHRALTELALSAKADAIFFSELSLSGYEPALAKELATTPDDQRFDTFQTLSDRGSITIGFGMPTRSEGGIRISMLIFQPGKPRGIYSKQQLFSGELPYFIPGDRQTVLTVSGIRIAPAICFESMQMDHAEKAHASGAQLYLASVAKHQNDVQRARLHYPEVARTYDMPVLMANCIGYCDNFDSAGQSAVWTKKGDLIARLDENSEGLIVFDTGTGQADILHYA